MVEDSRAAIRSEAAKPVNTPVPVKVEENAAGLPIAVRAPRRQPITDIIDRWRIDDEWWRSETISRLYYVVILKSGQRLVIYKELDNGGWHKQ